MAKTRPRNGHIILPVNTDLFESVEENAKEHGIIIGQYLDMLLQRHITPSEFFKGVKWPDWMYTSAHFTFPFVIISVISLKVCMITVR